MAAVRESVTSGNTVQFFDKVRQLDDIKLRDGCANIEMPSNAISYDCSIDTFDDYQDRAAFKTEFTDETKELSLMV